MKIEQAFKKLHEAYINLWTTALQPFVDLLEPIEVLLEVL